MNIDSGNDAAALHITTFGGFLLLPCFRGKENLGLHLGNVDRQLTVL